LKDSHNQVNIQNKFISLLNSADINGKEVGKQYEDSLSNSYRNKEGIYYTPINITKRFFEYLPENFKELSFCDPCCGSGNFIITAIKHGIPPEQIYGYDVDKVAVEVTKKRIYEHTGYISANIQCLDFLECSLKPHQQSFDIIFTNPPWGKKINKKEKDFYGRYFKTGKSLDTYSLFFFASLERLTKGGYLGFFVTRCIL
jgi:site-specific DNA-methyltransferase (adenine-specific)